MKPECHGKPALQFHGIETDSRPTWKSRKYLEDGCVVEERADGSFVLLDPEGNVLDTDARPAARVKTPSVQTRFQPHVNHSITPEAAARHGLERTADGGTYIPTEKKLNEYLAAERDHGRDVHWRDH